MHGAWTQWLDPNPLIISCMYFVRDHSPTHVKTKVQISLTKLSKPGNASFQIPNNYSECMYLMCKMCTKCFEKVQFINGINMTAWDCIALKLTLDSRNWKWVPNHKRFSHARFCWKWRVTFQMKSDFPNFWSGYSSYRTYWTTTKINSAQVIIVYVL